jgi:hypothetical protein
MPDGYRSFLGLYWLTAPLAWLYAIPVERFLSVGNAVAVNLWLLGIVSFWRVALMSRVLSVVFGWKLWAAGFVVMLFADAVVLAVLFLTPLPVFDMMGGIRLTEGESIIQGTAFMVGFLGVITLPVWLILSLSFATSRQMGAAGPPPSGDTAARANGSSLWYVAFGSLIAGLCLLPWTQPEQQNRRQVQRLMRGGQVDEALEYLSVRARSDLPPHWEPPPRIGYGEETPSLAEVLDGIATHGAAEWVRSLYVDKAIFYNGRFSWRGPEMDLNAMDDEQLSRLVKLMESTPKRGPELAATFREQLEDLLQLSGSDRPSPPAPGTPRRALLDNLMTLAHQHDGGPVSLDELQADLARQSLAEQ